MAVFFAYETLSVSTSAVPFTSATFDRANVAFVTVEGSPVRYRVDGTAPTASVGHELLVGDALRLNNHSEVENIQFISIDGNTATLRCSFGNGIA